MLELREAYDGQVPNQDARSGLRRLVAMAAVGMRTSFRRSNAPLDMPKMARRVRKEDFGWS